MLWDVENLIVMSWLLNTMLPEIPLLIYVCLLIKKKTMLPEISKGLGVLPIAKEIRDAIDQSYSKIDVVVCFYELEVQIHQIKQDTMTITHREVSDKINK